jgi:hypothetical protein
LPQPPTDPRRSAYFGALGEFIHYFAEVELMLNYVVPVYLGMGKTVFETVFAAQRADRSSEQLRKVISLKPSFRAEQHLTVLLDQLAIIQDIRNRLVHFGPMADIRKAELFVSNADFVAASRRREMTVTVEQIKQMTMDLEEISELLFTHHLSAAIRPHLVPPPTWHYKSPSPENGDPISTKVPRRERRHRSRPSSR